LILTNLGQNLAWTPQPGHPGSCHEWSRLRRVADIILITSIT